MPLLIETVIGLLVLGYLLSGECVHCAVMYTLTVLEEAVLR